MGGLVWMLTVVTFPRGILVADASEGPPSHAEAQVTPEQFYEPLRKAGRWRSTGGREEVTAVAVRGSAILGVPYRRYDKAGRVDLTITARKGQVVADPRTGHALLVLQAGEMRSELAQATFDVRRLDLGEVGE
jgi:hypothetical protein